MIGMPIQCRACGLCKLTANQIQTGAALLRSGVPKCYLHKISLLSIDTVALAPANSSNCAPPQCCSVVVEQSVKAPVYVSLRAPTRVNVMSGQTAYSTTQSGASTDRAESSNVSHKELTLVTRCRALINAAVRNGTFFASCTSHMAWNASRMQVSSLWLTSLSSHLQAMELSYEMSRQTSCRADDMMAWQSMA